MENGEQSFSYDHGGRLILVKHGLDAPADTLCTLSYDELGRLAEKKIRPQYNYYSKAVDFIIRNAPAPTNTEDIYKQYVLLEPGFLIDADDPDTYLAQIDPNLAPPAVIQGLQTMNYGYHLRGMLNCVNCDNGTPSLNQSQNDLFAYKLDFQEAGKWDGNIGKQSWATVNAPGSSAEIKSYAYGYDRADRLLSATYTGSKDFSVPSLAYDLNGNIQSLSRKGDGGYIDQLSYQYQGNRLTAVADAVSGNENVGDFRDGNTSGTDYTYWPDGSLKSDANKGISLIEYDSFLKKVKQVTYTNGKWIKWFYDGQGDLLKRENSDGTQWTYSANAIYKNDSLYQISFQDGRVVLDTHSNFNYEFEYRDHLGNLRLSIRDTASGSPAIRGVPEITQQVDYYPFGLEHYADNSTSNNSVHRFNSTLKIDDFGLNVNQAVFRMQDPQLGVWWQQDQKAEQAYGWTPYRFGFNNPIRYSDALGLFETEKEAKNYARENNIRIGFLSRSKIVQQEDGSFAINNRKAGTAISNDEDFGITTAALALGEANSNFGLGDAGNVAAATDFSAGALANRAGQILENRSIYGNPHPETIIRTPGKTLPNIKVPTQTLAKVGAGLKIAGTASGALGLGITLAQYRRGDITGTEASVDAAFGVIGFSGIGAPISLVYFGGKFIYEYSTGKTLFEKPKD